MKVSSPIGELPFELTGLRLSGGALVVEGRLGSWHSEVRLDRSDLPMLARALRLPLCLAGGSLALAYLAGRRR